MAKNCVVSIIPVSPYQRPMPIGFGIGVERAPRVLVEADGEAEVGGTGSDGAVGHGEGAAAGGAAVPDVDERQPGQSELVDEGVGVAAVAAAAEGELGLRPTRCRRRPGPAGWRGPPARAPTPRRCARTGGCRCRRWRRAVRPVIAAPAPSHVWAGRRRSRPRCRRPVSANGTITSSIGWPISSSSGSAVVSRASTMTSPGELDVSDAVGLERLRAQIGLLGLEALHGPAPQRTRLARGDARRSSPRCSGSTTAGRGNATEPQPRQTAADEARRCRTAR